MTDLRTAAQAVDDAYFDDAAPDMQMKIAMSALRAALEKPECCEWTYDEDDETDLGCWNTSCKKMFAVPANPRKFVMFCPGCGKPIKFLESEDEIQES